MDVYRVGVSLVLNNGLSNGLNTIIMQLGRANAMVNQLNSNLGRMRLAAAGAAGILGGTLIFEGMKKLVEHGKEVNNQLERMKQAGMSFAEIQAATAQAQKTSSNVMTTTYSENLKHLLELRFAFGSTNKAMEHLDEVSKANTVLNAMKGGGKDQVWEFVKSLEGKNITADSKEFSSYLNTMTQVVQASGGRVDPKTFFGTFKYGRTATQFWDQSFIGGALPRLMQEMGSSGGGGGAGGPGNALMTAYSKIVQGQMSKTSAAEFQKLGLGTAHEIKGSASATVEGIPGQNLFARNPYEWVQQILAPALKSKGITDEVEIGKSIQRMMGVRTAADALVKMYMQGRAHEGANSQFEKDIGLQKGAVGLDQGFKLLMEGHYDTVLRAFNAQWTRLLETMSGPAMAVSIPLIRRMADALEVMGRWASQHGQAVKVALQGLAALGAGLFVAGLIAIGVAIGGVIGVGGVLIALAAGITALAATTGNLQAWKSAIMTLPTAINTAIDSSIAAIARLGPAISGAVNSAISSAISGIGGFFGGASKGMPGGAVTPGGGGSMGDSYTPMNYRAKPPGKGGSGMTTAAVHMDGKKVGHIVMARMGTELRGPIQGSVYPDSTRMSLRNDTSYVT